MTKDSALLTETAQETPKVDLSGQSLDDIIKADRKTNRGKGRGRGRGRGKRGRGRNRRKRGGFRGGHQRGRGMYGGRGFYTPAFRQMHAAGVMLGGRRQQHKVNEPLQVMYQLVSKHALNPTIAVLQTPSENGRSTVQVQVDLDISALEGKPAGSFGLRQLAWGHNKQDAKRKAVSQMLTHPALQNLITQLKPSKRKLQNNPTSLFPSMNQPKRKKKNNQKNNKKGNPEFQLCWDYAQKTCTKEKCKWKHEIPGSLWKKNSDRAITLFEAFMTENGNLLSFEFKEDPENEDKFVVTCVVDGNNEGEGKGSRFEAKVAASKSTYEKFLAAKKAAEKEAAEAAKETEAVCPEAT